MRDAPPGLCSDAMSFTLSPSMRDRGARRLHGGVREERHLVGRPRSAAPRLPQAFDMSPSLRPVWMPSCAATSACARCSDLAARVRWPTGPASHSIFSALRPCIAAQVLSATTATPAARLRVEVAVWRRRDRHHGAHAAHLARGGVVEGFHAAVEGRANAR